VKHWDLSGPNQEMTKENLSTHIMMEALTKENHGLMEIRYATSLSQSMMGLSIAQRYSKIQKVIKMN